MDAITLTDGSTARTIDIYYDTSGFELLSSSMQFGLPEHDLLWHRSDWADGEILVRESLRNREWPMRLAIRGSTADALANDLINLNRLTRQARRYERLQDVDKVYMTFTPDGGQTTNYDVVEIRYDQLAFMEYFNRQKGEVLFGEGFGIVVITKPWGYGTEVSLANEVRTPHFEEDSNSDGGADNWTTITGTTTALDTTTYFFGTQSQHVTTPTTITSGIYSDAVTVSGVEDIAAYAWAYRSSGSDDITFDVQGDVTGSLDTATYDAATITDVGPDGNTWRKLQITGATTASDTAARMYIRRLPGTTTTDFYVDKCYLGLGATSVPLGWMSYRNIENHHDAGVGDINYVDVSVPGDLPAPLEFDITHTSAAGGDKAYLACAHFTGKGTIIEGEDMTASGWSTETDANCSGGYFIRRSATGSAYKYIDGTYFQNLPVRVIGRIRSGTTSNVFRVQMVETSDLKQTNEAGVWEEIDFGVINPDRFPEYHEQLSTQYTVFSITTHVASTLDLDYLSIIPSITDGTTIVDRTTLMADDDVTYITYDGRVIAADGAARTRGDMIGASLMAEPDTHERFVFWLPRYIADIYNGDLIDDTHKFTIRYMPRTEFFFGTE